MHSNISSITTYWATNCFLKSVAKEDIIKGKSRETFSQDLCNLIFAMHINVTVYRHIAFQNFRLCQQPSLRPLSASGRIITLSSTRHRRKLLAGSLTCESEGLLEEQRRSQGHSETAPQLGGCRSICLRGNNKQGCHVSSKIVCTMSPSIS